MTITLYTVDIPRQFCRCARGLAAEAGGWHIPDTLCTHCDTTGRSVQPAWDMLLDISHAFAVTSPRGANRVAMSRPYFEALRREAVSSPSFGPMTYREGGRQTQILGMRVDIDAEAMLPVVSRVEAP